VSIDTTGRPLYCNSMKVRCSGGEILSSYKGKSNKLALPQTPQ